MTAVEAVKYDGAAESIGSDRCEPCGTGYQLRYSSGGLRIQQLAGGCECGIRGAVDPENEFILCEMTCGPSFNHFHGTDGTVLKPVGGVVEILEQTNCYVVDRPGETVTPEPDAGSAEYALNSRDGYIFPFTIAYCWSASGSYRIMPYNEVAPWSASVRAVVTFNRLVTPCDMQSMFQLDQNVESAKFPKCKITYSLKPIQPTGETDGENNEV